MNKIISPSPISGSVHAPASKSYAQRALAAALLARGTTILRNPSRCHDALAAMEVIQKLGATIEDFGDRLVVHGGLNPKTDVLNFGEAGLGIRLFASIASLHDQPITLTGEGSLTTRPMGLIEDALKSVGVKCFTNSGKLPIQVQGPIQGGKCTVDGSISSQVLSGLIMALPLAKQDSVIHVENLKSTPYIDMTLEVMDHYCIKKERSGYTEFRIPGNQFYHPTEFAIEGDWSGAAFLLVAGAIAGDVEVMGLNPESKQADKAILDALGQAGVQLRIGEDSVRCAKPETPLEGFFIDATHCPDLFPPLVALAAHCHGISIITGVDRLIYKESNRAKALLEEMGKLGVKIDIHMNEMIIEGPSEIKPANLDSHNDHRIAMAATVISLPGKSSITISDAECINKSYPEFYQDIIQLGGKINE
jgi:3-phosphoshikimate 1-carboxyvinyltransferase